MQNIVTPNGSYHCAFEVTIDIIGGKWKSIIIWNLLGKKVLRTNELKKLIPKITQKMLTQQLRELENSGIINRKVYNQVPPKVEYSLTEVGIELSGVMKQMYNWGKMYVENNGYEINNSCKV
jgi:DNA-binding HxlR family transcriptional regulator